MKQKEQIKLSKSAKILVLDRAIGKILDIFLSTFLAAYFYKITQDNMIYLSIYNIIAWITATIGAFTLIDYIKRKNKIHLYRFGTFIKGLFILLIIILGDRIIEYVWLIGICYGISTATTGFPLNMIESELVEIKERSKYLGYRSAIGEITKIVVPIFLGAYITFTSYQIAAILILLFVLIKIFISFFIENKYVENTTVDLKKFWKEMKAHKEYPIGKIYMIEFLKGITVNGVLDLIISLLIIYQFETELNLGIWTSIFSICMVVTMMLFAKYYNKNKANRTLTICMISIIISFACVLFSINKTTIIIYNFIYYIFIQIMYSITEIRLFNYSNKPPFDKKLNTEYFMFRELFLNIGRVLGYLILLIVGMLHNVEYIKFLLFCTTIALILTITISKKITKYEEKD